MAFTIYRSTDGAAPTLSGTAGDLIALLKACLVDGYAGKAAAGWTLEYSAGGPPVTKAVFRPGAGTRFYVRILDDGSGAGALEATAIGYEVMTGVDTGTGPFPTAVQLATGVFVRKSKTSDATARAWILLADSRTFYLCVLTTDTANTYYCLHFGDFYSLVSSDAYNCMIAGRQVTGGVATSDQMSVLCALASGAVPANYVARNHVGTAGSLAVGKHGDAAKGSSTSLLGTIGFTNAADGGIYLSPVWIHDTTTGGVYTIRGRMRGFWQFLHAVANVADGDTFSGVGAMSAKAFLVVKIVNASAVLVLETSDTLETN